MPGVLQILGARSLEGMNLRVDARAKRLVAGGPILAARGVAVPVACTSADAAQKVVKAIGK